MELQGTIKFIGQTEQVSQTFQKRDVVIMTEEQYPQHILVQFTQAKCDELNAYQVGQQAIISINLRGKEYQDKQTGQVKYFNTIQGWKITAVGMQQHPQQPQQQYQAPQQQQFQQQPQQQQPQQFQQQQGNNGLPF